MFLFEPEKPLDWDPYIYIKFCRTLNMDDRNDDRFFTIPPPTLRRAPPGDHRGRRPDRARSRRR